MYFPLLFLYNKRYNYGGDYMDTNLKKIKTIFETVTPYYAVDVQEFSSTPYKDNKYYIINNLNERYILTKYVPSLDPTQIDRDYELSLEMQGFKYIPDCLYYDKKERIKITERIYPTANLNFLTKTEMRILANSLRGFHKLKHKTHLEPYNPFDIITHSRALINEHILPIHKENEIINNAYPYYLKNEKYICHNFLLKTNVIINNKNTYFFNYDYMGSNDPLYDITMLFVSLNIKEDELIRHFLSIYYGNNYNEEKVKAFYTYIPLVKLVLIYALRKIHKENDTVIYEEILTELITELRKTH